MNRDRAMLIRTIVASAALLAALVAQPAGAAIQHPNLERGFSAETAYQVAEVDQVNLFNGNLSLTVPIGQRYALGGGFSYGLTLVYNSKSWDWETVCDYDGQQLICIGEPHASTDSNAGLGWTLSLGRLYPPGAGPRNNDSVPERWLYVGPDGAEHWFYDSLPGVSPGRDVYYTRDNSYLRLRAVGSQWWVEYPDGVTHRFQMVGMDGTRHQQKHGRLVRMEDRFGNYVTVAYGGSGPASTWTLRDSAGRTHTVNLVERLVDGYWIPTVSSVDLAAFGGRALYELTYGQEDVERPCPWVRPTGGATPLKASVPLLTHIDLPEGLRYAIGTGGYQQRRGAGDACYATGTLQQVTLPSKAKIAWTHGIYRFPTNNAVPGDPNSCMQPAWCETPDWLRVSAGVRERRLIEANTVSIFTYTPYLEPIGSGNPPERPLEMRNTVVDPLNNTTIHYFSAFLGGPTSNPLAKETFYGLPFTVKVNDGTNGTKRRFLSRRIYQGSSTLVRSEYLRYEWDYEVYPGFMPPDGNRRQASQRTIYHDDGGVRADVDFDDFDGAGHYRKTEHSGNFWASDKTRTTYTGYYGGVPTTQQPWLLNLYGETWQQEGNVTAKQTYCFDTGTGFLKRKRAIQYGVGEGSSDLIEVYTADGAGNAKEVSYHGGDNVSLSTSSNLCGVNAQAASYAVKHTWTAGALATSTYLDGGGSPLSFKHVDQTIDSSTGLVSSSRDTAGAQTTYSYDQLGRLTLAKPALGAGAKLAYAYLNATGVGANNRARAIVAAYRNDPGFENQVLAHEIYVYDPWGRLWSERRRLPDGAWARRDTDRNILGWTTRSSTWSPGQNTPAASRFTQHSDHDVFGRAGLITPPDQHDVDIDYFGVRSVARTVKVKTANGLTAAKTVERYDRHGRLIEVSEPAGGVMARYGYDVGNRLASVDLAGGIQGRTFAYDNLGFLRSESHPEKTAAMTYGGYDARGHAGWKRDPGVQLDYSYDRAERLVSVYESWANRLLQEYVYASQNAGTNLRRGKLEQATRHNWINAPATPGSPPIDLAITETYEYRGRGGRASWRDTDASWGPSFYQKWSWSPMGELSHTNYPRCDFSPCNDVPFQTNPFRVVETKWSDGQPTQVVGYAGAILYHPDGRTKRVARTDGTTYEIDADPFGLSRPLDIRLRTPSAPQGLALGLHSYDGAGNLMARGDEVYEYDQVSRLKRYQLGGGSFQTYTFDGFGNLTAVRTKTPTLDETRSLATATATNRLSSATYDPRGNLTSWGDETHSWDALNMLKAHSYPARTYLYTADNERVAELHYGGPGQARWVWSLRDLDGKTLRLWESDAGAWTWEKDYVYRGSELLAAETSEASPRDRQFFAPDHLGTPRLITDRNGTIIETHHLFGFGEELAPPTAERKRFTGHERDWNDDGRSDDLDYMHARYCSPHLGRFLSTDPAGESAVAASPQSWNRYSYARGNPSIYVDPDGRVDRRTTQDIAMLEDPDVLGAVAEIMATTGLERPLAQRQEAGAIVSDEGGGDYGIDGGVVTDGQLGSVALPVGFTEQGQMLTVSGKPIAATMHSHPGTGIISLGGEQYRVRGDQPSRADVQHARDVGAAVFIFTADRFAMKLTIKDGEPVTERILTKNDYREYLARARAVHTIRLFMEVY